VFNFSVSGIKAFTVSRKKPENIPDNVQTSIVLFLYDLPQYLAVLTG
jgi:hypothetical protein